MQTFDRRGDGSVRIRLTLEPALADSLERSARLDGVSVIDAIYDRLYLVPEDHR